MQSTTQVRSPRIKWKPWPGGFARLCVRALSILPLSILPLSILPLSILPPSILLLATLMVLPNGQASARGPLKIVAFGDSLVAGYGLPPGKDFATRLEAALKQRGHDVAVMNAGVSGDTTSSGRARFDWAIPEDTDAVILELGANDALRGIPPETTRANLDDIMARLQKRDIPVLLAGMRSLANWGEAYVTSFEAIFPDLAARYGTLYYPFFLEGVIDAPKLKLPDALHPNEQGVEEVVRRILPSVEQLIARARNGA